jgi:hypothetical protein
MSVIVCVVILIASGMRTAYVTNSSTARKMGSARQCTELAHVSTVVAYHYVSVLLW